MKVLLVDDHPLILAALQSVITCLGSGIHVTTADSGQVTREILSQDASYDLVLLDLHLGDTDGFELLGELRARYPAMPVVVISGSDSHSDVIRAIDMGAMGFVPKRTSNETLIAALQQVVSGGVYVPPNDALVQTTGLANTPPEFAEGSHAQMLPTRQIGLTPRQTEVLHLLLKGQPNKLIARELGLSVETVKDHVAAVLRTLGVSSRTQAVIAVSQLQHKQSHLRPGAAWAAR